MFLRYRILIAVLTCTSPPSGRGNAGRPRPIAKGTSGLKTTSTQSLAGGTTTKMTSPRPCSWWSSASWSLSSFTSADAGWNASEEKHSSKSSSKNDNSSSSSNEKGLAPRRQCPRLE